MHSPALDAFAAQLSELTGLAIPAAAAVKIGLAFAGALDAAGQSAAAERLACAANFAANPDAFADLVAAEIEAAAAR